MNVCFYTDQSISGMTGGIGRVTSVLTDYFRHQYGWKVFSIYAFDASEDSKLTEVDGAIKLRLHDRMGFRRGVRKNYCAAVDFIKKNKIDVVYVQTSLDVVSRLRKAIAQSESSESTKKTVSKGRNRREIKIVSVLHFEPGKDEWPWSFALNGKGLMSVVRNLFVHKATVKAYRTALIGSDVVSVLSPSYIAKYTQYAGIDTESTTLCQKLVAVPNPVSFDVIMSEDELMRKEKICLVVARMEERQKRISEILRIWEKVENLAQADASLQGWRLVLVGEGPSLTLYKAMASSMKLKSVSFEGRQDSEPYYRKSSVFLMTSTFEGFPMTLVEAQQYGCVPLVYDAFSALKDVVCNGENGLIVDNMDETAYLDSLCRLMTNVEYRQGLARRAVADSERFSKTEICGRWKKIIEEL